MMIKRHETPGLKALGLGLAAILNCSVSVNALAMGEEQSLSTALRQLSDQSGLQIGFESHLVKGVKAGHAVHEGDIKETLRGLLKGTSLAYQFINPQTIVIRQSEKRAEVGFRKIAYGTKSDFEADLAPYEGDERADEVEAALFDEIIVTAQKREQSLSEVPISIAALGARELADRGINDLSDLAIAVPGLTVQSNGGLGTRITVRGIGASGGFSSPLVGVYLDDISTAGNPAFNLDLRAYDLERVEVLRGPQGTLFGDGSVGGTIRFITKKPQLDSFSASANLEIAGTKDGAPSYKSQGVVNIPLVEDKLGMRIVGTFDHASGWIDQPGVDGLPGQKNINTSNVFNVRTNILWKPSENLEVSGMAIIHRNDGNLNTDEDENGNGSTPFGITGGQNAQSDYEMYGLTVKYDFGFAEFVSASSHVKDTKELFTARRHFLAPPPAAPAASVAPFNVATKIFNQEVRLSSNGEGRWHWLIGGNYRDREVVQDLESFFALPADFDGPLPATPFVFDSADNTQSFALFGETSYELLDWLEAGGGLRYFSDDRTFISTSNGVTTPLQGAKFDAVTGRIFIRAAVTEDINTYASYSEGFRSGGINPLGIAPFDAEGVQTYELGMKGSFFDGRVDAELALYHTEFKDSQLSGVDPATTLLIFDNGGDAEIDGIEASFSFQLTQNFRIDASGNYNHSEIVAVRTPGSVVMVGDRLPFSPTYNITVSSVYDFEWGERPGFARLDYSQAGRSFIAGATEASSDVINMLNANIQLDVSENVSMGVFARNLLNDRGYVDAFGFNGGSRPRPRTIGVKLGFVY